MEIFLSKEEVVRELLKMSERGEKPSMVSVEMIELKEGFFFNKRVNVKDLMKEDYDGRF